jgi:phospholipase/carboxylesterase
VAGLAGFLPDGIDLIAHSPSINDLTVYISHGNKDTLVPISKANHAVQYFQGAGAEVTFCESDVGHKLSADCFKGLEAFFEGKVLT